MIGRSSDLFNLCVTTEGFDSFVGVLDDAWIQDDGMIRVLLPLLRHFGFNLFLDHSDFCRLVVTAAREMPD